MQAVWEKYVHGRFAVYFMKGLLTFFGVAYHICTYGTRNTHKTVYKVHCWGQWMVEYENYVCKHWTSKSIEFTFSVSCIFLVFDSAFSFLFVAACFYLLCKEQPVPPVAEYKRGWPLVMHINGMNNIRVIFHEIYINCHTNLYQEQFCGCLAVLDVGTGYLMPVQYFPLKWSLSRNACGYNLGCPHYPSWLVSCWLVLPARIWPMSWDRQAAEYWIQKRMEKEKTPLVVMAQPA